MSNILFPPSLKPGDRIAVISPAGTVTEEQLKKGLALIEANGYEAVPGKHLYTDYRHGYNFAGTEQQRAEDINWALNSEDISAVWTSRGGYGCQHLLQHIDLTKFLQKPRWYIGYSDNTVIQSYLLQHGFASIHAQTIKTSGFGVSESGYSLTFDILKGKIPDYDIDVNPYNRPGTAEGLLVGGNLALIYALMGTTYSFNFEDKILFIEEIGEKYYALDRMLMALELAGVFSQIKGLIIGGMTLMEDETENPNYEDSFDDFSFQVIAHRIKKYDFPAIFGFPNGHIFDNRPLIIGANVYMRAGDKVSVKMKN